MENKNSYLEKPQPSFTRLEQVQIHKAREPSVEQITLNKDELLTLLMDLAVSEAEVARHVGR